jgi:palmitoyltransferase ZDHHC9/14/18
MSNIILASIGRPQFPSWVNASAWEKEDTRSVNPALLRDLRQKREYL